MADREGFFLNKRLPLDPHMLIGSRRFFDLRLPRDPRTRLSRRFWPDSRCMMDPRLGCSLRSGFLRDWILVIGRILASRLGSSRWVGSGLQKGSCLPIDFGRRLDFDF